jgi:hypothetical protein
MSAWSTSLSPCRPSAAAFSGTSCAWAAVTPIPVADDGEEVARFNALVSDDDCPDTHTGAKRKRSSSSSSSPRVLRVPIIRASGSWTGAYVLSQRGLARLAHCGLEQNIMNVDDFLFACSADHPRRDLIHSPPVQSVRLQGPFVSLAIASSLQRAVFGVDMTEASKRGDCFYSSRAVESYQQTARRGDVIVAVGSDWPRSTLRAGR